MHNLPPALLRMLAVLVVAGLALAIPTTTERGLAVGAAATGLVVIIVPVIIAAGLFLLNRPMGAVIVLLVTLFFQMVLPKVELPVQPLTVAFILVVGSMVLAIRRRTHELPALGAAEAAMALYVVWNIASAVLPHHFPAGDPGAESALSVPRFILVGVVIPFVLFIVGRSLCSRTREVKILLWIVVAMTALSVVVSILQLSSVGTLFSPSTEIWEGRAVGIFNQPVVNGLVLIIGFVTALYLAKHTTGWPARIAAYLVAASSAYATYLTHTRAVWLAFLVALLIAAVVARGFRAGFILTLTAILVFCVVNWSTLSGSDRKDGGVTSTNELQDRMNANSTALWAIEQRPLAGWGIGRFAQVNTYHHKQWSPDIPWVRGYGIPSHENELGIAAELGMVGLGLWLAVIALVAQCLVRALRDQKVESDASRGLAVVAVSAFIAQLVVGVTVDLRFLGFSGALVLLLVGLCSGQRSRSAEVGIAFSLPRQLDLIVPRQ